MMDGVVRMEVRGEIEDIVGAEKGNGEVSWTEDTEDWKQR